MITQKELRELAKLLGIWNPRLVIAILDNKIVYSKLMSITDDRINIARKLLAHNPDMIYTFRDMNCYDRYTVKTGRFFKPGK